MATNPYCNKIVFNNHGIDLTEDTVKPNVLGQGFTAHDKSGALIIGNCAYPLEPLEFDYNIGYVDNGKWTWQYPTNTHSDIYEVQAGHTYLAVASSTPGTRWRIMFTDIDVREVTSGAITGERYDNTNNPAAYRASICTNMPSDGYLIIGKDNNYVENVKTYLLDVTDW